MNIIGMLPSEIQRLRAAEPSPELTDDILDSIERLLATGNPEDEAVFLAAVNLSKAGLDRFVSPSQLAPILRNLSPVAQDFLEGLDQTFRGQVATEMIKKLVEVKFSADKPRPSTDELESHDRLSKGMARHFAIRAQIAKNWASRTGKKRHYPSRPYKTDELSIAEAAAQMVIEFYAGTEISVRRTVRGLQRHK